MESRFGDLKFNQVVTIFIILDIRLVLNFVLPLCINFVCSAEFGAAAATQNGSLCLVCCELGQICLVICCGFCLVNCGYA